jgi:NAD(P)H-dependent flavin oxidoreductase YrpB (nitropropane dioxygenase family)
MLLRAGLVEGNTEAGVLAAGQVSGILEDLPTCQELIDRIVTDAVARIGSIAELAQDAESAS